MNQLKMDIAQTISTLSRGGWSQRRIARELGIDRETVARYRRLARTRQAEEAKPAIVPAGSEAVRGANSALVPPGPQGTTVLAGSPKPAIPPAGSEGVPEPKSAIVSTGSEGPAVSASSPYATPKPAISPT